MVNFLIIVPTTIYTCEKSVKPEPAPCAKTSVQETVKNYLTKIKQNVVYYRQITEITKLITYVSRLPPLELTTALHEIPYSLALITYIPDYLHEPIPFYVIDTPDQTHQFAIGWSKGIEIAILSALVYELASIKNADEFYFEIIRYLIAQGACCWSDDDCNPIQNALQAGNMNIFCLLSAHSNG